jgi:hypothetical protein
MQVKGITMPVKFIWEENGLYWDFYGTLDGKSLMGANGQAIADPRFEEIHYIIWDSRNISQIEINENDAELSAFFVESVERYNPDIKLAFVTQNDHFRGLAQYYIDFCCSQGVGWQQQIFGKIQDARAWVKP